MELSFIIVNWNTKALLLQCLDSIRETVVDIGYEIWVVDNASTDGSAEAVQAHDPGVHLLRNEVNLGFAAANNQAFSRMAGRYAILLNSDARLTPGAARILYDYMEGHPDAGMACGQLLNADGSLQRSVANFPSWVTLLGNETLLNLLLPRRYPGKRRVLGHPIEVESGIGACLILRKAAIDQIGGFDEGYFFFFEETDYAKRMWENGWKVMFVPQARIVHEQGKSVGTRADGRMLFYRSRYRYLRKWHPSTHSLLGVLIVARLLANFLLSGAGVLLTAGCVPSVRVKTAVYGKLLLWHLMGCP
ncbi:glycosyltransferase family 2 protein [Desulfatirhabdium butyrativorans]|uniref:glycosyltransferase family 2 protein n=1 Tax=Desulfatirhabdium butyrativorans TaxID=340467 RepID=UPI000421B027|nr:glycosyltransferase family 2 protein [Desulfatirhabdium butyrativorans]